MEEVGLGDCDGGAFGRSRIGVAKRPLNSIRREMVMGEFEEGHIHQENDVSPSSWYITRIFVTLRCSTLLCTVYSLVHSGVTCYWRTRTILLPGARQTVALARPVVDYASQILTIA